MLAHLLKSGHNVAETDALGWTSVHHLCASIAPSGQKAECLQVLQRHGADVDAQQRAAGVRRRAHGARDAPEVAQHEPPAASRLGRREQPLGLPQLRAERRATRHRRVGGLPSRRLPEAARCGGADLLPPPLGESGRYNTAAADTQSSAHARCLISNNVGNSLGLSGLPHHRTLSSPPLP